MGRAVALLKGINVGGNNLVPMAKLRGLFEDLGFRNVKTLLQSGNVVFDESGHASQDAERLLSIETEKLFGFKIEYFVRSASEWEQMVASNPFVDEAKDDPGHLIAMLAKGQVSAEGQSKVRAMHKGPELLHFAGEHIYISYPDGVGTSKLTGAVLERNLGVVCTGRNWNTVLKLHALLKG